jgi:hypothetical protein
MARQGRQIGLVPRPSSIEPDGQKPIAPPVVGRRDRRRARTGLVGIGDGILKVQNDQVARQPARLFDRARVGGGEEQGLANVIEHFPLLAPTAPIQNRNLY